MPSVERVPRLTEHVFFSHCRYGRVQSVKLLPPRAKDDGDGPAGGYCAAVAFMDIKSASKAHASENSLDDRCLVTDYYEPLLGERTPSASSGAGSAPSPASRGPPSHAPAAYERPSSHYFERRSEPDAGSFLRRQPPPPHHYRDRAYRSAPFAREPHFARSSSGPSAWGGHAYEPPPSSSAPSGRYAGHDYDDLRSERLAAAELTSNGPKRAPTGAPPVSAASSTPLSTRKRKSR